MVAQLAPPTGSAPVITWEPLPDDYVLPDDPVENIEQPFLAAALTDALDASGWMQPEMLIASNFALVATVNRKTVVKAPDWLFVPKAYPAREDRVRRSYTPHTEGGAVAVVMEFLSETETGEYSVRPFFPYGKLYFYEHILQVPTYVIFDSATAALEVRQHQGDRYIVVEPDAQNRVWIPEMNLFVGVWHRKRMEITTHWLRWWDQDGQLLLWHSERAEQERQRADRLAAKLQELGIDPDLA